METPRSTLFRPYAQWIITHRAVVVGVILVITGFLASRLGTLQVDSNPNLWAPQQHPYVETTNLLEEVFGGRNLTVIGVVPKSGDVYQPAVLEKIKRLQEQIELSTHAVRHNVLSLAARKVKLVTGTPEGMEVRQMMEVVPRTPEADRALEGRRRLDAHLHQLAGHTRRQSRRRHRRLQAGRHRAELHRAQRGPARDRREGTRPQYRSLPRRPADHRRSRGPRVPEDADVFRIGAAGDHPGAVLVVQEPAGHVPAAPDRHPQRDLEPRADGPARRASRSAQHDHADPGAGRRVRPRDPDPEALLRGVLAADQERPPAEGRQPTRGGRVDRSRRSGDDGRGTDRHDHVLLAGRHRHPDGAALRRVRGMRRAGDDDHRDDGDTRGPHDAAAAQAA